MEENQFTVFEDNLINYIREKLKELPIVSERIGTEAYEFNKRAWGKNTRLDASLKDTMHILWMNMYDVTHRDGFQMVQVTENLIPQSIHREPGDAEKFLAVMTFINLPQPYAYPHHIYRTGEDKFLLFPCDIMTG